VSFTVSKQIRRTLTLSGPSIAKPGDTLTFVAHLHPSFPETRYQFTFGEEPTGKLDPSLREHMRFRRMEIMTLWDGGKGASEPLTVSVHSITYVLTLVPSPRSQTVDQSVNFHASDPHVENVHYTFDFGDGTKQQESEAQDSPHVFSHAGNYEARVSLVLPDHGHKIVSAPTRVMILPPPKPHSFLVLVGAVARARPGALRDDGLCCRLYGIASLRTDRAEVECCKFRSASAHDRRALLPR
jgi:hypothetical protein